MNLFELSKKSVELGAIQKVDELHSLLSLLNESKPKVVVEIGTAKGGVFYSLCKLASQFATIISIDLPGGKFGGGYSLEEAKKFKKFARNGQSIHCLRDDSHKKLTLEAVKGILKGRKIDLLFVDGDHSYKGVKKDWELYSPLVRDGGLIAFHDILFHPHVPSCQVDHLWKEIKNTHKSVEFVDFKDITWGGIGVLFYHVKNPLLDRKGLLLDLSPIPNKQKGFLGMARKVHPNVDVIHDPESFPFPFEDDSCHIVIAHYLVQKIKPWLMVDFMNEVWRIVKPGGQFAISMPYANSASFYGDPTNCNQCNESTFYFFDPQFKEVYAYHEPKPWQIESGSPQWTVGGNLEILMRPRK